MVRMVSQPGYLAYGVRNNPAHEVAGHKDMIDQDCFMPHVEKMSVALTQEMAEMVRQAVETGEYASSSEVVREALRGWKHRRDFNQTGLEELRRLWTEGLQSGPGRYTTIQEIIAEARRRAPEPR